MSLPSLVLASTSPHRRELLMRLGLPFGDDAPGVDERRGPHESAPELVRRLSRAKADAAAARHPGALIIGSDQAAERDGDILGKPGDHVAAMAQLKGSSGKRVTFHTGLCLLDTREGRRREHVDVTAVRFRTLSDSEIERYLKAEKPYDCAGSFKSEGLGASLFESVESSDPTALVGLPLIALSRFLRECGLRVP
ncbi:MAG TPA: Maf family nucleotide pyrophosphatase [Gammaproteobacteria bacterium]|nr:Maf family nucleotide pyrophosphatase [Gammaproteobacteria bacterium]